MTPRESEVYFESVAEKLEEVARLLAIARGDKDPRAERFSSLAFAIRHHTITQQDFERTECRWMSG